MVIRSITAEHHGRQTRGMLYLPGGESIPAVLFSHGYNGCMTDFDGTARFLAEQGIGSLTFTFSGGSTRDTSGFPTTAMTLETEREDLLAMLELLFCCPEVDRKRVFLFGGSMGGLVSLMAASGAGVQVAGLALLFPALCIPDNWNQRFPEAAMIPERLNFWELELGRGFFLGLRELDVWAMVAKCAMPTLLLHGDQDAIVPLSYSQRALELLRSAKLEVFPGEGHGFGPEASRKADELLLAFLREVCIE